MPAYISSAYRMYSNFRKNLENADTEKDVFAAVTGLFPTDPAQFAAVVTREGVPKAQNLVIASSVGSPTFWANYLQLCHTNQEPLARVLRTVPRPTALADLQNHPKLCWRAGPFLRLLTSYGLTGAFAIPAINRQFDLSFLVLAGHSLILRPSQRQLLPQVAADTVHRLQALKRHRAAASAPQHLKLTARQMEIAAWIVAGKTDWEIGEILRISPKTVNFHVENIKRAYGVKSRNQFVAAIIHDGGLTPQPVYCAPSLSRQSAVN